MTRTQQITALHHKAMKSADMAMEASRRKFPRKALSLYANATKLEAQAASFFRTRYTYEPTRSVLYRSAASLAILAGESRLAEKLACEGLAGNPPGEIAEELRNVLRKVIGEAKIKTDEQK